MTCYKFKPMQCTEVHFTSFLYSGFTTFAVIIPPKGNWQNPPLNWFLKFLPPSTSRLLQLWSSFFQKIPPTTFIPTSTFIVFATFAPLAHLFQPPRLLEIWECLGCKTVWLLVLICWPLRFSIQLCVHETTLPFPASASKKQNFATDKFAKGLI